MKIKRIRKKYIVFSIMLLALLGAVGVGVYKINVDASDVSAYEITAAGELGDVGAMVENSDDGYSVGASETFSAYYDVRDEVGGNVRNKDQHSEGLCGLYAATTAMEYALAKQHWYYEVSAKHLDYMTILGDSAYKQENATNVYFDRYLNGTGADRRGRLGDGVYNAQLIFSLMSPLAIMSEANFTSVMKNNDSRLASISRYEDIWSLSNKDSILVDGAYAEKQDFNKVNDASKTDFVITGIGTARYSFDGSRGADSSGIRGIKDVIQKYGGVSVQFPYNDLDACRYVNEASTSYTIINDQSGACNETYHAMAIVGWDDNWEYEYAGQTKRGAFILQNSWGEHSSDKRKWHIAYISALLDMVYFNGIERYDSYDYYYGPNNYRGQGITPENNELIYEMSSRKSAQLKALTFATIGGSNNYEVYISVDGDAANFVKDGIFKTDIGITKYELKNEYQIDGNYAIKLKKVGGSPVSDEIRQRNTLNVMAAKVTSHGETTTTVTEDEDSDSQSSSDDSHGIEEEENDDGDIAVPNTSADDDTNKTSNTTNKSPVTGGGSQGSDEGVTAIHMLPMTLIIGITALGLCRRSKRHRKFE